MADHQLGFAAVGRFENAIGVGDGDRDRLFQIDRHLAFERVDRVFHVYEIGTGDDHAVEIFLIDHFAVVGVQRRPDAELLLIAVEEHLLLLRIRFGSGNDHRTCAGLVGVVGQRAAAAAADNADSQVFHFQTPV